MIGILLVSHGTLGASLISCASHVFGERPPLLDQLSVSMHDDPAEVLPRIQELAGQLDQGDGVLVLADIYGATPSNICCRMVVPGRVEIIAGANLPMLVRALTYREEALATVVQKALSGGRDGIFHITAETCNVGK